VGDDPVIEQVDPRRPEARDALRQYLAEIVARGAVRTVDERDADDVAEFADAQGCFLLAYRGDTVIGCGGLRTLEPGVGELKRMWVHPDARGAGVGSLLLDALIEQSRALGHTTLRLDTNAVLTQALAMYAKHGFVPIARYNDNPDATDFLEKTL
jgi:GNAT superfamily N-acetyltransferase